MLHLFRLNLLDKSVDIHMTLGALLRAAPSSKLIPRTHTCKHKVGTFHTRNYQGPRLRFFTTTKRGHNNFCVGACFIFKEST